MNTKLIKPLVMTILLAVFGLTAASAQEGPAIRGNVVSDGPQFEFFTSSFVSDLVNTPGDVQFGLRGSLHLTNRFALEGSLSRYGSGDVWLGDLSAKYYVKNRGRMAAYLIGGPGVFYGSGLSSEMTVHLGVGLEVPITHHLYVRPEVRGIALAKDLGSAATQVSLGVGWRM